MKKLACVALLAGVVLAGGASAAGPSLTPHIWGVTITGASPTALNGTWLLGIKQTQFEVAHQNAIVIKGTVKIAGTRITFHDVSGPLACKGVQASGAYTWRIKGTTLNFRRVHDTCPGRSAILVGVFRRVK